MGEYVPYPRYRKEGFGISRKLTKQKAIELLEKLKGDNMEFECNECVKGSVYKVGESGNKYVEPCWCAVEKDSLRKSRDGLDLANLGKGELNKYDLRKWVENKKATFEVLLKRIDTKKAIPEWVFLWGSVGTGKTYNAIILALLGILREKEVLFISVSELMDTLRPDYGKHAEIMRICKRKEILVLDDIGKEKASEWVREQLHIIIDVRYRRGLMTVFTSNFSIDNLKETLSPAIYSRVKGEAIEILLEGNEDKRII